MADISLNQKGCNSVSATMSDKGFESVFEHIQPTIRGRSAFTLWVNISSGMEVLTTVNDKGECAFYELRRNDQRYTGAGLAVHRACDL